MSRTLKSLSAVCTILAALGATAEEPTGLGHRILPPPDAEPLVEPATVLDRSEPGGPSIPIGYALIRHQDQSRAAIGTVVPNPGGPGPGTVSDTDFPLARLTCVNLSGNTCTPGYVYYAFTHDDGPAGPNVHSIAPTNFGYTHFDLPSMPRGMYDFQTVTNGVPSNSVRVNVFCRDVRCLQ